MNNLIDLSFIKESIGDDRDVILEFLSIFKNSSLEYLNHLTSAINNNDFDSVAKASHKFAPSAVMLGLNEIHALVKQIEKIALDKTDMSAIEQAQKIVQGSLMEVNKEIDIQLTH